MDNNEVNKTSSNLNEENMKWLEEMASTTRYTPESAPEAEPDPTVKPAQEADPEKATEQSEKKSVEEQELDEILSTDWDHITLPDETATENESVIDRILEEESAKNAEIPEVPTETPQKSVNNPKKPDTPRKQTILPEPSEVKGRPRKQDSYGLFGIPHILSTAIWVVLILAIGISLGRVLWVCCADLMAFGKDDIKATITITAEDNIDSIAEKLGDAKLIKYPNLFKQFAKVTGKDDDICVGTYTLSAKLDYNAMINAMYQADSQKEVVEIMFPDGVTCEQIFQTLADNGVCELEELEKYAAEGDLNDYWFLEGIPRGDKYRLEGYLAPDTYAFYKGDSPRRVLEKFLTEFDERFTEKMRDNFETMKQQYASMLRKNGFSENYIAENQLTVHQLITLASLVQNQAATEDEGYQIAAVLYARLWDPKIGFLGADEEERGIPPKPICNMGVQSIYAVLEPNENYYQYRYFVYDRDNKVHVFIKTEKEYEKVMKELGY